MQITPPMMVFAYWAIAVLIGFVFFRKDILTFNPVFDTRRVILLVASVLILILNVVVYGSSTYDGGRTLDIPTLIVFSIGNGIAETFMFYAVFRLGEWLASKATTNALLKFCAGFIFFMIFSGIIHGLFWLQILPEHINQSFQAALYAGTTAYCRKLGAEFFLVPRYPHRDHPARACRSDHGL